eukprot:4624024-Ditylum_brightwellii.AAC.1
MKPGNATLDHLNRVRLYLGATTLADLCDDNGMYIRSEALTGKVRLRPLTPWPNEDKPSPLSWRVWCRFLRKCFATTVSPTTQLDKNWPLDEDLGLWTATTPMIWRRAYIDPVNDTLYSRDDNGSFTLYHRMPGHMSAYAPSSMTTTRPQDQLSLHRSNWLERP